MHSLYPLSRGRACELSHTNYRLLAITSVVAKVFEKLIDITLRVWAERLGILTDLQGGFRERWSTTDQIFILNEIIGCRSEQGIGTVMAFIDVRAAYDRRPLLETRCFLEA